MLWLLSDPPVFTCWISFARGDNVKKRHTRILYWSKVDSVLAGKRELNPNNDGYVIHAG